MTENNGAEKSNNDEELAKKNDMVRKALARAELLWRILADADIPTSVGMLIRNKVNFEGLGDEDKLMVVKISNFYYKGLSELEKAMEPQNPGGDVSTNSDSMSDDIPAASASE